MLVLIAFELEHASVLQETHAKRKGKPPNLLFRSLVALHLSELWCHFFWTGAEVGIRCGMHSFKDALR